ncbi:pyridoxamine 5'-phosphate oxidase family protein [Gymnodinialimonas sp. 2305UL16-5]|uniref:pyridoxamine 5'-phosphate oxidase family protein n=1 Tax=Gymnodinialimonas mytili TaxID=3126503 RepID=UPI0030A583BF
MAKQFSELNDDHIAFIGNQHLFFVGSAAEIGRVNVSPKGMDSLRVIGPNRILWVNLSGSGNETAGHLQRVNRMTLMWCSFSKQPLILRCFGTAETVHRDDAGWDALAEGFPEHRSARQIFDLRLDLVQTSCGWAVPFMDYAGERPNMQNWVDNKSDAQIRATWARDNRETIDGLPTGIPV